MAKPKPCRYGPAMHAAVVLGFVVAACKQGHDPCDDLENEVAECYDDICDDSSSAGSALCSCWDQGKILDVGDCSCTTLDLSVACAMFEEPEDAAPFFDCNRAKMFCAPE